MNASIIPPGGAIKTLHSEFCPELRVKLRGRVRGRYTIGRMMRNQAYRSLRGGISCELREIHSKFVSLSVRQQLFPGNFALLVAGHAT